MALTIGFGLPWTIYLAMGHRVVLATSGATEIMDGALLGLVVLVALFFLVTTLASPSKPGGVQIDRPGAVATMSAFAVVFAGLVVLEALYQEGIL